MNCTDYKEQISRFVDNELEPLSQIALFDHLAECMECQLFLDSLMKFKSLKNREEVEFPSEIDEGLFNEVNRRRFVYRLGKRGLEVKTPFWERKVAMPMPALAAMIVVAVLGVSSLFVNLLAPGRALQAEASQRPQTERVVQTRETIVYGLPAMTVYGQDTRTNRTGL